MIELILEWILFPLFDMLSAWHISGKWRLTYLFPVATALGVGLWWIGDRFDSVLLIVFGAMTAVLFGIISLVTFIPREAEFWRDLKAYKAQKRADATANVDAEKAEENDVG